MTEAECWRQIEQFAKDKDYAGVAVLADALQERGWGPEDTLSWWATRGWQHFDIYCSPHEDGDDWYYYLPAVYGIKVPSFREAIYAIHNYRKKILCLVS